jgi:tetratricopeptide (TPR) repeat protein
MTSLDDTQPNIPLTAEAEPEDDSFYPIEEAEAPPGPGCLLWGVLGVFGLMIAILIVILAGSAGWTAGQNEYDRLAASEQRNFINTQLTRIPSELADNNLELVGMRLNFMETAAPNMAAVQEIRATVTAMAAANATATLSAAVEPAITGIEVDIAAEDAVGLQNRLAYLEQIIPGAPLLAEVRATIEPALAALQSSEAPQMIEATAEATPELIITEDENGFDLANLLNQAEVAFAQGNYRDAYDVLDAIIRIDASFERAEVQGLLRQTLTAWAESLYLTADEDRLAEAIRVTNLLQDTGAPLNNLAYEREIGGMYLDAIRAIDLGNHSLAIQRINDLLRFQEEYKGVNLRRLLFNEYMVMGDAWRAESNFCQAAIDYNRALGIINDSRASSQYQSSQQLCEAGATMTAQSPLPGQETGQEGGTTPIAPVGQPGS